jgi:hypothetical protein
VLTVSPLAAASEPSAAPRHRPTPKERRAAGKGLRAGTPYRGAARVMAADLAGDPRSGLTVQMCGDAHVSDFGLYGSPERRLGLVIPARGRGLGRKGVERDFCLRQLRDWKGSIEVDELTPGGLTIYGQLCAWWLARAHARSGDRIAIAGYGQLAAAVEAGRVHAQFDL